MLKISLIGLTIIILLSSFTIMLIGLLDSLWCLAINFKEKEFVMLERFKKKHLGIPVTHEFGVPFATISSEWDFGTINKFKDWCYKNKIVPQVLDPFQRPSDPEEVIRLEIGFFGCKQI